MGHPITESAVEETALSWFNELDYSVLHGPDIAPGEPAAERSSYAEVVLLVRLRTALTRINPSIPVEAESSGTISRSSGLGHLCEELPHGVEKLDVGCGVRPWAPPNWTLIDHDELVDLRVAT